MELLRAATPEEVTKIASTSDLDATCVVMALDSPKGPTLFVIRRPVEVDPVYMPEGFTPRHFVAALRDVGNLLIGTGATHYYFNLHADEESKEYRDFMEHWGAVPVSTAPDIRYKKQLILPQVPPPQIPQ